MYERSYGAKYGDLGGRWTSAADIAKLMRIDIKSAIATGELPGTPKNYSVKIENYSGGRSIRIRAIDLDGLWQPCEGVIPGTDRTCQRWACEPGSDAQSHEVLNSEGQRIEKVLKRIWSAYNHDGSDVMTDYFDVNYYGDAQIESSWDRRSRLREKERAAARKTAKAGA